MAEAKKAKNVDITKAVNLGVPNGSMAAEGLLESTIDVGKKFKGLRIRDVNATVQTTGSAAGAAGDLQVRLTAPNQATVFLFGGLGGQSIGPLTLDDESPLVLLGTTSAFSLGVPYAGTAQPGVSVIGGALSLMDDERVRGAWTLSVADLGGATTSVLNSWRLSVRTGKPYRTEQ
jgi:subtilisin-like proprotein convertase family protein